MRDLTVLLVFIAMLVGPAFAALNILDGKVAIRGVTGPSDPSVYGPVLQELEEVGLGMTESLSFSNTMETKLIPGLSRQVVDRA